MQARAFSGMKEARAFSGMKEARILDANRICLHELVGAHLKLYMYIPGSDTPCVLQGGGCTSAGNTRQLGFVVGASDLITSFKKRSLRSFLLYFVMEGVLSCSKIHF